MVSLAHVGRGLVTVRGISRSAHRLGVGSLFSGCQASQCPCLPVPGDTVLHAPQVRECWSQSGCLTGQEPWRATNTLQDQEQVRHCLWHTL